MGRDKALISLAGRPLIDHAVTKLRRVCADVSILSSDSALAGFAPIVPDLHPQCGPIGGIEAALSGTSHDWNLFFPVDMPLLPTALLWHWIADALDGSSLRSGRPGIRIFTAGGRPQPGLCLIHRAIAPLISSAIAREDFALLSIFEEAGGEGRYRFICQSPPDLQLPTTGRATEPWRQLTKPQVAAQPLWFLNVNTREDLALAKSRASALDT